MTANGPGEAVLAYGRMIKFSHSIFAMPFALAAAVLAAREVSVTPAQVVLIVLCMVLARSTAMGFNRIVDRQFDAANPRTASRELPAGVLPLSAAVTITSLAAVLFVLAAALLHPLCGWLAPVALLVVCGYSYAKRFTSWVHVWLGVALGLAPVAVWIALTGGVAAPALLLAAAVATWVAGFDILYSLQDEAFDRDAGLRSVPVRLGQRGALVLSALLHVGTITLLAALPWVVSLDWAYWAGWLLISGVLVYEHSLVKPGDFSKIDKAFFDLNGYVSLVFFLSIWLA